MIDRRLRSGRAAELSRQSALKGAASSIRDAAGLHGGARKGGVLAAGQGTKKAWKEDVVNALEQSGTKKRVKSEVCVFFPIMPRLCLFFTLKYRDVWCLVMWFFCALKSRCR